MLVPEVRRQLARARIEELGVLEHLVVEIILGGHAERARLDPHVDVLRHQDHIALGMVLCEVHDDGDDLVVRLAARERRRQGRRDILRLQEQAARRRAIGFDVQRNTLRDAFAGLALRGDEVIQPPAHLPRVARDLRHALLVVVEFLEREDRQIDVVLLEPEQARGIVHQDIGIENEELRRDGAAGLGRLAGGEEVQRGWGRAQLAFDHGPPGFVERPLSAALPTIVPLFTGYTRGCGRNLESGEGIVVEREQRVSETAS